MKELFDQKIFKELDSQQDELNGIIQKLIQIRSYSGEEKEIVEYILEKMREYDFDEAFADGLGNAVGRIGNGPIKILFDAHIDTVRVTEDENWQYPPFEGKIVDGKIYGRGAVDEKPAMAGYLLAGKMIKKYFGDEQLPFTLYVVGSVLEEDVDGYPLYHLIQNEGIKPDFVVLGEPTDLRIYRGQRGRMELKITTTGKSAHSAHNQQGINAIYKMNGIVQRIEALDRELSPVEPLGKGSITVSQIISRAPSLCSVPDFCQIHIDRRLTVGETRESVISQLKNEIEMAGVDAEIMIPEFAGVSWKGTKFTQEAYFPTWVLDTDHVLVKSALDATASVLGEPSAIGTWSFSTNGVVTAGHFGIPTIGFAPGKEELSHSSKEELDLNDLLVAAKFYASFPFHLSEKVQSK